MDAEHDIVLCLVGVPHVARPTEGVFPAKGYILIAMLLLAGSGRMSRQAVAALLWDDAPEEKALTNLRQLLVRIHRCWPYEEALVETSGPHLSAGPGAHSSDLASILRLQKSAVLAERVQAVLMAKGELLDTIDTGGGELAQWFRGERERFRRLVLTLAADILTEMTRFARAQERDIDAIGECMLALEPEREESFRALIEAYGRNGNYAAVTRTFARLTETLRSEFNSEPGHETQAAMRRILASAPRPRSQHLSGPGEDSTNEGAVEISAARRLERLPRVALFPPVALPGQSLHPLHRALIEDVANDLSRHRTFTVVAPHSSFAAAESSDGEQLRTLRTGYLVTGFMVPGAPSMALRLTRQPSNEIIWAAEYQVGLTELSAAFRIISRQIALTLASEIERDQIDQMRAQVQPLAYRHYLEGQIRFKNCDLPKLRRARIEFQKAAELDRGFAAARGGVALALQLEWLMLGGDDPSLLNHARIEAEAALEIDIGDSVGHWMTATVALYQRDFDTAAERFLYAETLNPHSADLLLRHADALGHLGDPESGWERFQRALLLNPFPPDHYWWTGATIAFRRQDYQGVIGLCSKMESDEAVLRLLASTHGILGNTASAYQYASRLREAYPRSTAAQMSALAPDRRPEDVQIMIKGLQLAGID